MTVERLIELLEREYPQALVFVKLHPCTVGGPPRLHRDSREGVPVSLHPDPRKGWIYIEADGHDC